MTSILAISSTRCLALQCNFYRRTVPVLLFPYTGTGVCTISRSPQRINQLPFFALHKWTVHCRLSAPPPSQCGFHLIGAGITARRDETSWWHLTDALRKPQTLYSIPITTVIGSTGLGASPAITSSNSPLTRFGLNFHSIHVQVRMPSRVVRLRPLPLTAAFHYSRQ